MIKVLKITSTSNLTTFEAMEVAVRAMGGIALDETHGDQAEAARLVEAGAKDFADYIRGAEAVLAVKDGHSVN